ncbi:MAG: GNAT family N-acetyltransferase [Lachnospiraceae bacterium]|nr:GNAT family N-acetyltransferase [Lachnospiraceae bacterium]
MLKYQVRFAYENEWQDAMYLVWKTFLRFEAQDYTEQGIESFKEFITDQTLYKLFKLGTYQMMVALDGERIVGVISLRNNSHISLLFVDERYHRQGVGSLLIHALAEYLSTEENITKITVNAAPYAIGFYHKLGFKDTSTQQESDGIKYTPMEYCYGNNVEEE